MSLKVSILIRQSYPLNRQLDASAGELVLRKIESLGVEVKTKYEPKSISTHTENGVEVFDGFDANEEGEGEGQKKVDADLVIFAIGIAPRDDLARASGITCHEKGGVVVDDSLQTSAEDIYAIGECANWRGNVSPN